MRITHGVVFPFLFFFLLFSSFSLPVLFVMEYASTLLRRLIVVLILVLVIRAGWAN